MSVVREPKPDGAPRARRWKVWQWYLLVCFIAGGVVGLVTELDLVPQIPRSVWLVGSGLLVVLAMAVGTLWMREIDELAQQAHYVAWFWGGSIGMCVLLFLVFAAPTLHPAIDFAAIESRFAPMGGESAGFVAGIMASLLVMTLGYGAWWLVFWLRRR
jgi:hypothetical protein